MDAQPIVARRTGFADSDCFREARAGFGFRV
jgi:hypothetical protein